LYLKTHYSNTSGDLLQAHICIRFRRYINHLLIYAVKSQHVYDSRFTSHLTDSESFIVIYLLYSPVTQFVGLQRVTQTYSLMTTHVKVSVDCLWMSLGTDRTWIDCRCSSVTSATRVVPSTRILLSS